ncbi:MAG: T9SS type A sorting domain-containing protein [Bacteroidetes bacterium]|nr:T9SS type A sorting domain-containing protein [Bacteroidota bacterium]
MLTGGDMHWDLTNSKYEVPKNSGKHTVFASAFWIGGMDASGQLHVAAQTYRQTGMDFWPGPIDGISLPFDTTSCTHFNKIWKISKWEVEMFKNQFSLGNVTNGIYTVPNYFLSWPAKGNNNVTEEKAPYIDFNNDGLYNPFDGDYPLIKGDQMLFWMFNDSLAPHSASDGPNMGVEVHASAYAYACPSIADSNAVLNTTTLYHYKILNRSLTDYSNVYLGLWCDTDLGYNTDDYIGCDTTLAAGFVYNSDNDDHGAYGLNPPMQNVVVLKGPLADQGDGLDNDLDGTIDETGERTTMNHFHSYWGVGIFENPYSDNDHYKYMTSFWLDSSHVTYGAWGGYNGTVPSNFIYSGTPYDSGWSETSIQSFPDDRLILLSSGPVTLLAGDTLELDFAYVFTRDSINPNGLTTSVARNKADLQRIHSWFDNDSFPSCIQYVTSDGPDIRSSSDMFMVYPNPAGETIYLDFDASQLVYQCEITIYNLEGQPIKHNRINNYNIPIDIQDLPSGIFFVELKLAGKKMYTKFAKIGNVN